VTPTLLTLQRLKQAVRKKRPGKYVHSIQLHLLKLKTTNLLYKISRMQKNNIAMATEAKFLPHIATQNQPPD
jgi:hypothetical protein